MRPRIRQQVMGALVREKTTCVMVTHDPFEAFECADRVFDLRDGTLHEARRPA